MAERSWARGARAYVVATTPLAGSDLLRHHLGQTGVAGVPEEYFVADIRGWPRKLGVKMSWPAYGDYVQGAREQAGSNGVFGVTLHWHQFAWLVRILHLGRCSVEGSSTAYGVDAAMLLDRLLARPAYIWLRRGDSARQAIDYLELISTGKIGAAVDADQAAAVRKRTRVDLTHIRWFEGLLEGQDRHWGAYFRDGSIEPLEVCLEDLLADPDGVCNRILDFLDLPRYAAPADGAEPTLPGPRLWAEAFSSAYAEARPRIPDSPPPSWADLQQLPTRSSPSKPRPTDHERVVYSCVVDQSPLFRYQSLIWYLTLRELGGVRPDQMVVHVVNGTEPGHSDLLRDLGVSVVPVKRFDRRNGFANKLRQLESEALRDADRVVLCDCDLAFCRDISNEIGGPELAGRVVDLGLPEYREWVDLQRAAGLRGRLLPRPSFANRWTYAYNFNGGFLVVPAEWFDTLGKAWPRWLLWLLDGAGHVPEAKEVLRFADQVSLGLTILELDIPVREVPASMNLTTVVPMFETYLGALSDPLVLHYHDLLDAPGLLKETGALAIDQAIGVVNQLLSLPENRELIAPTLKELRAISPGR